MFITIKNLIARKRFENLEAIERKCITYNALGLITEDELADLIIYAREVYND